MPRTARRRRTLHRRIRTIAVLAVASGGTAAWLVTHNDQQRVRTVPAAAVADAVLPGLERLPDLVPVTTTTTVPVTTTTVTVPPPVYHPPVAVASTTTVARAVPPSGSPVRATTTTMAPTSTTRPPVVAASAAITSCGAYPYTVCIPPVGNPAVWSCILSRESSGNPQATGRQGEIGLFQIAPWTLSGLGYTEAQMRSSIPIQIQAATKLYLARGFQPWTPSDGCR